jgi:predicted RNA-binding protein with PIN domain
LAIGVARQGEADDPVAPAPTALRPFLAFAKLPPAALEAARRVLEDDAEFRARVLVAAGEDEHELGRPAWLWLARPEGWEHELAELATTPGGGHGDGGDARDVKRHARRQLAMEAVLSRAETRAQRAEEELDRVKAEASELRRANRRLVGELERTEAQVVQLTEERTRAVRQLKAVEATLAERALEARRQREEVERLRAEHTSTQERLAAAEARAAGLPPPVVCEEPARGAGGPGGVGAAIDLVGASRRVADASVAAERLASALADLAGILLPSVGRVAPLDLAAGDDEGARRGSARRRPVRLAGGAVDDSPEAALFLARLPDAVFLVDGYNVSKTAWPDLELSVQRLRLVNAVAELRNRLGTHVEVVFDGADEGRLATRALPKSVKVWFSPQSIEADDWILSLIDAQPPEWPVVTVSSDRRVKDGARARGSSVLSSRTFLTLLR